MVENQCWNCRDDIICIKCPFELRDLIMFTKNVNFGLHFDSWNSLLMSILNVEV